MDLSLGANPEAPWLLKPRGHPSDAPLRSWPLSRRSGRFPPEPYLPLRSFSLYANNENMLASPAGKGVENHVPRRWKWPVLRWPRMAGFGVATEGLRRSLQFRERARRRVR